MVFLRVVFMAVAGLAVFLCGMKAVSKALRRVAGNNSRRLIQVLTKNPLTGLIIGLVATAILQSSSATTIIVVALVDARLMKLKNALGVVLGAGIGTTLTAQLISFDITDIAVPTILLGVLIMMLGKSRSWQRKGKLVSSLGVLFFGLELMSYAVLPLRTYQPFIDALASTSPIKGMFFSALFTGIVQSSSVSTAVIVTLASQGVIGLQGALPLVLGSNIGTTVTSLFAAINTRAEARCVAYAHLMFNLGAVLLFLIILEPFGFLVSLTSPLLERQVANAHSIFNIALALTVLPFVPVIAEAMLKMVRRRR